LLLVEDYDLITGYSRTLIIIMQLIFATGTVIIGLFMVQKAQKDKFLRRYFYYIAGFFFGLGIGRFFFIIHDFYIPGLSEIDLTPANIVKRIAVSFTIMGLTSLAYLIETDLIKATKKGFSIFGCVVIITQCTLPFEFAQPIQYIANPILSILPAIVYIYLYKTGAGTIKKQAFIVLIGILTFGIGQMFFGLLEDLLLINRTTALTYSPPISLLGLIIIAYGFFRYNKGEKESI
jgi:hypothetical protein